MAREQAAEQARAQYESGIQQLAEQAQAFVAGQFSDIKTWEDAQRLATEDPIRFNQWKVAVDRAQQLQAEQARIHAENQRRQVQAYQAYLEQENAKFLAAAPEFTDPQQAPRLYQEARALLIDEYGFTEQELAELWSGRPIYLVDSRIQLLIREALNGKRTKASLKPKPNPAPKQASPPPQRPGTPPIRGEATDRALEQAKRRLAQTHSVDDAVALLRAKRRASA